jgi:predicted acetyltransferase
LELCHHDYSEFNQADVDDHGLYGYSYLDHYWTETGRYAFFIKVAGKLAGFVMVRVLDGDLRTIAEFFVLRKYRRLGVGKTTARAIFDRFPGQWRIDQEPGNTPAQHFWRGVIGEYTHGHFEETIREMEGEQRPNQRFVSGG